MHLEIDKKLGWAKKLENFESLCEINEFLKLRQGFNFILVEPIAIKDFRREPRTSEDQCVQSSQ